jgi:hypothetical protein
VVETPSNHPLRAIAWVLNDAPVDTTIRVLCYSLTDPLAIDLLIHAGGHRQVLIILHPSAPRNTRQKDYNREALKRFVDLHGKMTFLANIEMRLANLTGSRSSSALVSMHDKSIITTNFTTFGSYDLSNQARAGNWESLCVATTSAKSISFFDNMWNSIPARQVERYYTGLNGRNVRLLERPKPRRRGNVLLLINSKKMKPEAMAPHEEQYVVNNSIFFIHNHSLVPNPNNLQHTLAQ